MERRLKASTDFWQSAAAAVAKHACDVQALVVAEASDVVEEEAAVAEVPTAAAAADTTAAAGESTIDFSTALLQWKASMQQQTLPQRSEKGRTMRPMMRSQAAEEIPQSRRGQFHFEFCWAFCGCPDHHSARRTA